jgi:hypothetical protein
MASSSDAERLSRVVDYLRGKTGLQAYVPFSMLRAECGVDLGKDPALLETLRKNEAIDIAADGTGIKFKQPYDLRDGEDLLSLLRQHSGEPILESDVRASNAAIAPVIEAFVADGTIIRMRNIDQHGSSVLFHRRAPVLCTLPGRVTYSRSSRSLKTDRDLSRDVLRGDVLRFPAVLRIRADASAPVTEHAVLASSRVSTATGNGEKATPCLRSRFTGSQDSAAPWRPHIIRDSVSYWDPVSSDEIPLSDSLRPGCVATDAPVQRFGVSADLRALWRQVRGTTRDPDPPLPPEGGYPLSQ